jgi:AcrR family transcriptional regulator
MIEAMPGAAASSGAAKANDDDPSCSDGGGRRDRKKRATRQALRDAALRLVAERGYAHVTIEDITEAADVATRTFFNYFSSKEAAIVGADPERVEQLRASLLARPIDESPLEALRAVLIEYATAIDEETSELGDSKVAWFRRFCAVRGDRELLGAFSAYMAEVERGLAEALAERIGTDPTDDLYPALIAAAMLGATRVAALYWSAYGGADSLVRLTSVVIDELATALVTKEAFVIAPTPANRTIRRRTRSKCEDTITRTRTP